MNFKLLKKTFYFSNTNIKSQILIPKKNYIITNSLLRANKTGA